MVKYLCNKIIDYQCKSTVWFLYNRIFAESYFRTDYTYLAQAFPAFIRNLSASSPDRTTIKENITNSCSISRRQEALRRGWRFILPGGEL